MDYQSMSTADLYELVAQQRAEPGEGSEQVIEAAEHEIGVRYGWALPEDAPDRG